MDIVIVFRRSTIRHWQACLITFGLGFTISFVFIVTLVFLPSRADLEIMHRQRELREPLASEYLDRWMRVGWELMGGISGRRGGLE